MFSINDTLYVAEVLEVDFSKFPKEEFLEEINIEVEYGLINPKTNVTNNDLITTAKIALAHLNEFPNYYNKEYGLKTFEQFLKMKLREK